MDELQLVRIFAATGDTLQLTSGERLSDLITKDCISIECIRDFCRLVLPEPLGDVACDALKLDILNQLILKPELRDEVLSNGSVHVAAWYVSSSDDPRILTAAMRAISSSIQGTLSCRHINASDLAASLNMILQNSLHQELLTETWKLCYYIMAYNSPGVDTPINVCQCLDETDITLLASSNGDSGLDWLFQGMISAHVYTIL
jgi:hypothetical protein